MTQRIQTRLFGDKMSPLPAHSGMEKYKVFRYNFRTGAYLIMQTVNA